MRHFRGGKELWAWNKSVEGMKERKTSYAPDLEAILGPSGVEGS